MAGLAPSGEQFEIALDGQRAVVVQVLSPWPNRVQDGSYEFDGRRHQLVLDEPQSGNAIHGLVRWSVWSAALRDQHRVVMEHTLHPRPGYPFAVALSIEYSLSAASLRKGESRVCEPQQGSSFEPPYSLGVNE